MVTERIFGMVGLVLVLPTHAIAGAVMAIRDNGLEEFRLLVRMTFAPWNDRNPNPSP